MDITNSPGHISEIEEIRKIFEVKIEERNSCDNSNSESDYDSECSYNTYDTFDTSDSEILKKQEIKMDLLVGKKMLKSDSKSDFDIIFKKLLDELKKKYKKKVLKTIVTSNDSDSSSEYYLHGYNFF